MKRLFLLACAIVIACAASFAAHGAINCAGQVVDDQGEPIVGATVSVPGSSVATSTDIDGKFKLNVPDNARQLKIVFIGYKPVEIKPAANIGIIRMDVESTMLNDVIVTQSAAKTRLTPVAVSTVGAQTIDVKLGNQELPEVLKTTPGVWTTKQGGGFGDAKTNVRGFRSENVGVMINGIPINDMEWGGTYWSNWGGLADVTSNIQVQRGLGATVVSTPSVGGTINITTRTIDVERGGSVWYGMGNDGMNNYGVKVSTGLMKNGWAVTVLGSRKWGDNYIQGTPYNSYNYFANVSKRLNENHQLALTAFGASQKHDKRANQRSGLGVMGYQTWGRQYMGEESMYRYNPTFGYDRTGQVRSQTRNNSHKPQISLNHIWKIDETSSLSSAVYVSLCDAGGYSGQGNGIKDAEGNTYTYTDWYGATDGVLSTKFRRADGTFDYGAIQELNAKSTDGSKLIMSNGINRHQWYGLVSSYKKEFQRHNGDRINLTAGIDLRYYIGEHKNEIVDLYDGEYFIDYSTRSGVSALLNSAAADPMWQYQKLGVGDVVFRNYKGYARQEGAYAQGEYTMLDGKLNLVLAGSINNTAYWRREFFYADKEHERSQTVNFWGGTIKGGANYNIDKANNVFFNAGYISRAPFFQQGAFLQYRVSNAINENAVNEKIASFEVGYGYSSSKFALTLNGYYTKWMDKTMTKGGTMTDGQTFSINMQGVDARHMGVELNLNWVPVQWLNLEGMLSIGNWEWCSDATGYFYNEQGQPITNTKNGTLASGILAPDHAKATVKQKGIKVSDSPQTQGSVSATFLPFKGFRIGADWIMESRAYAYSNISGSDLGDNATVKVSDPWRIPWGQQLDLNASYRFNIGGVKATLYG
ncbi:MAG: carboxypeptidase-like regulatory domain-containing protein, partial [Muribaculaceae bacterium]|nr:carboxypeptidase-like regulatory domain-containing protein [Muribaculaceae bacterium]